MTNLKSIEKIARDNDFAAELYVIPATEWMGKETDPEKARKSTLTKLETVDSTLTLILDNPDKNMQRALGMTFCTKPMKMQDGRFANHRPTIYADNQLELIHLIRNLSALDKKISKSGPAPLALSMLNIQYMTAWEENPKIGRILIDEKEEQLRLREAITLYEDYLKAAKREYYKQGLAWNLPHILQSYRSITKGKPKLMTDNEWFNEYKDLHNTVDKIYFRRGNKFLKEGIAFGNHLEKNEFSGPYILTIDNYQELFAK
jgi:hypothetical protein